MLQVNSVSSPELSPMQGGSLFPGRPISYPPFLLPPSSLFPISFLPQTQTYESLAPAPGDGSMAPLTCTQRPPSLADYQPASGTWAASMAGESKLTGTGSVGAVTKERTSLIQTTQRCLCAFFRGNSTDCLVFGSTTAHVTKVCVTQQETRQSYL